MAEAVIIDDGGSTRLKWANPNGKGSLEKLFDSQDDISKAFKSVRIFYQEEDGTVKEVPGPLIAQATFTIEVTSQLNQHVKLEQGTNPNKLTISLFGAGGVDPVVEAKEHNKKRRYIVSNSGAIETVSIDGIVVYDISGAANAPTTPAKINKPVHYTSVVLQV